VLLLAFFAAMLVAVWNDVFDRRIPNALVMALLAIAMLGWMSGASPGASLLSAVAGLGIGLGLWLPFWLLGLLGAGDVKFFAAGCAWLGAGLAWRAAIVAALLGGIMSVAVMLWRGGLRSTMQSVTLQTVHARHIIANADIAGSEAAARTFPYALPMALALGIAALYPTRLADFLRI
jgi:prepilin peptidase CpaA